jgi:hypothetical protein
LLRTPCRRFPDALLVIAVGRHVILWATKGRACCPRRRLRLADVVGDLGDCPGRRGAGLGYPWSHVAADPRRAGGPTFKPARAAPSAASRAPPIRWPTVSVLLDPGSRGDLAVIEANAR